MNVTARPGDILARKPASEAGFLNIGITLIIGEHHYCRLILGIGAQPGSGKHSDGHVTHQHQYKTKNKQYASPQGIVN